MTDSARDADDTPPTDPSASDSSPNGSPVSDEARAAREFVLESHAETVETVLRCADAVAETWDGDATSDPQSVAGPLRAGLDAADAWERLPDVLAGAVGATGRSPSATPVAAPPYVVATSRGPMLRATLDGGRLVILLQVFEVEGDEEAGPPTKYVRTASTPAEAVRATFK